MKPCIKQLAACAGLSLASPFAEAAASPPSAASPDSPDSGPVVLSPFEMNVSASNLGRYTSLESISAGRVRADIMDLSQSVSVITSEVVEDVAATRTLDAAKYIAGITELTLPTTWENLGVRGFLSAGRTVDGFTYSGYPAYGFQNLDPAILDRIEVVKGPNSILAPQSTSPGGTLNLATKKPQFRNFGVVSVQAGAFDANSAFVDVNRVATDRLAVRFVGSVHHWDNWWKGSYTHSTTLLPEFTYRFSKTAQVTAQYTYTNWKAQNYFGLPIDPTSSTTTPTRLLPGVPRDLDVFADDIFRSTRQHEVRLFFTSDLGKGLSMRLAAAFLRNVQHGPQMNTAFSTAGLTPGRAPDPVAGFGGSVDPLTGFWNYGVRYAQTPPYASSPLPVPPTRTFIRSGVELQSEPRQLNFQNDYAWIFQNQTLKSTALVGFAGAELRADRNLAYNLSAPPYDIDRYVDTPAVRDSLNFSSHVRNRFLQGYVAETLALFQNRVIVNAAESWQSYRTRIDDLLTGKSETTSPTTALTSAGVVLKPLGETVSLHYAYGEQSSSNAPLTGSPYAPPLSSSRQNEFGARLKMRDNRLYFTISHFDIIQRNFSMANPANLVTPPPQPLLPPLYVDLRARGWEYELRANPTRNLSLIGSYTHFKNRDQWGVVFKGVAEKAGGLLASYAFGRDSVPALEGFRIAAGADYLARRPGDYTAGFTAARVRFQPQFYLDARTLVNLTLAYDSKQRWGAQVNIDNVFDKEYILSAVSRGAAFPGTPRNVRVSLKYHF